jgi:regulator of replication initiation timing
MTEDQSKLLSTFENHIRQLMNSCTDMSLKNNELKDQITKLKVLCEELKEENKTIKVKYDNLKMARIITVKQDDFKGAKDRLSKLVKEVDKCIASLNE